MEKIGFVLEGGGTRGAYQAGAIKALYEAGIKPNVITGTSIGAMNGALLACDKLPRMMELYEEFKPEMLFNLNEDCLACLDATEFSFLDLPQLTKVMFISLREGGIDITPLKELVEKEVDEEVLRKSPIELGVVSLGVPKIAPLELYVEDIAPGKVHEFILASAYLPFFKAEERRYLDGMFVDNVPLSLLEKKGPFNHIYILRSHSGEEPRKEWLRKDITVISPSRNVGRGFELSIEKIRDNVQMGYYDTIRHLRGYKGQCYCFEALPNFIDEYLQEKIMERIQKRFSLRGSYDKQRFVYEEFIPGVARALGFDTSASYEKIFLKLFETGGQYLGISPYKVYDFHDYVNEIREKLKEKEIEQDWNVVDLVFGEVAKMTKGWLGDLERLVLVSLDFMIGGRNEEI